MKAQRLNQCLAIIFKQRLQKNKPVTKEEDKKFCSETETAVKQISDWKTMRMSYNCDTCYPESGEWIDLDEMTIPGAGLKYWISTKYSTIADKAQQICKLFVKEIENFRSYVKNLNP